VLRGYRLLIVLAGDAVCFAFSFAWVTILRRWEYIHFHLIRDHALLFGGLLPLWLAVCYLSGLYENRYYHKPPPYAVLSAVFINFFFSIFTIYFVSELFKIPTPKVILLLGSILTWATMRYWRENLVHVFVPHIQEEEGVLILDSLALVGSGENGILQKLKAHSWGNLPVFTEMTYSAMRTGKITLTGVTSEWVVERVLTPLRNNIFYTVLKRTFDLTLAVLLLPLAVVFGLFVACWIKIFLGGKTIYTQWRIGQGRKPFQLRKFKTMPEGLAEGTPLLTQENDPRVPRSVRWIRRLHLDEIPQIWNILKGEMSWIGPRPEQVPVTDVLEAKIPFYWARHVAPPGITGWAQVNMGYAETDADAKERLAYDLYYLTNRGILLDIAILSRTLRNLIAADGR